MRAPHARWLTASRLAKDPPQLLFRASGHQTGHPNQFRIVSYRHAASASALTGVEVDTILDPRSEVSQTLHSHRQQAFAHGD